MNVLFLMVPIAILIAGVFLAGFVWATKSGQFDDLETPSIRILKDETKKLNNKKSKERIET